MSKQKKDKKELLVKIMAMFLALLMVLATAGTFIYYLFMAK